MDRFIEREFDLGLTRLLFISTPENEGELFGEIRGNCEMKWETSYFEPLELLNKKDRNTGEETS